MQDQDLWHQKWASNKIGFHLTTEHPSLVRFWHQLNPNPDQSVFVPLCGKSEDLIWLADKHKQVIGVELSQIAVRAFFAEHLYTPLVTQPTPEHQLYQFDELSLYVGDFFTFPIKSYDLIYDRAALVALPETLQVQYVQRIKKALNPGGKMLLISLDYPQDEMSGPPFSVPQAQLKALFSDYKVTLLARDEANHEHPKIKQGVSRFAEEVYLIESE